MTSRHPEGIGFLDHLEELRRRTLAVLGFWLGGSVICYVFSRQALVFVLHPLRAFQDLPVFRNPVEPFMALVKMSLVCGAAVALPFLLLQTWMFVAPGLTPRERSLGRIIGIGAVLCTAAGAAFGFFFLLPLSLKVLFSFSKGMMTPLISISDYLNFVLLLTVGIAAMFNVPVVLTGLTVSGVVPAPVLARGRRFAYVGAFVLSAVITPTGDPVTQTLFAVPLILLYEISIIMPKILRR